MFAHVIGIPTVVGRNRVPEMAGYLAGIYRAAGWPAADVRVMPYGEGTAALIVHWRAPSARPGTKAIMLMGHMDVVEAKREDSTTDPFVLTERDGYYYGRGTIDMKAGVVAITQSLINLRRAGFVPRRDIVVLFTGDEETGGKGAKLAASDWKDIIGPIEFGLNADNVSGIDYSDDGKLIGATIQTAEKTYTNYTFTVRNRGGHSSKPRKDNAIYQLAHALDRLEAYRFTPMMNETTRAYFAGRQKSEKGPLGDAMRAWLANPEDGAAADTIEADERETGMTRTRCVATRLFAGHADNALPQLATATVNCRLFPGLQPDDLLKELQTIVGDPEVAVTRNDANVASLASPLRQDVMAAFTKAVHALHPGMTVYPIMSTGATDARPFRVADIPVYGLNGAWTRVPGDLRAHGKDERLPVQALDDDIRHWEIIVRELAGR